MSEKKRVGILLRVSTDMQARQASDEQDIPAQRTECMRFIDAHSDWVFEKEYMEIGVSGYKTPINERTKLHEINEDIITSKINVLVTFMFDRLGRKDEIQLMVKSFVQSGCEVWSVREGQMKFEEHIDDLLSFITFWQASGESRKTSQRVTATMTQMAEAGLYTGGRPPYGYIAVETGRMTKKKLPERTFAINEDEAQNVRLMFDLALNYGYGCHRIAKRLNECGIPSRNGTQWGHATVANILRNPIYMGVKAYNRTTCKGTKNQKRTSPENWILPPANPAWAIIPETVWKQVERNRHAINKAQGKQQEENQGIPDLKLSRGQLLMIGYTYCGCCGSKMNTGYSPYRWRTQDGILHRRNNPVYKCNGKHSGKVGCTGKSSYKPDIIEGIVLEEVNIFLDGLKEVELSTEIQKLQRQNTTTEEKAIKSLKGSIVKAEKKLSIYKDEVSKAIIGESSFKPELLNELIESETTKLSTLEHELQSAESLLQQKKLNHADLVQLKQMIPVWREEFEKAPFDVKKVLLSKILEKVVVYPDRIEIKLKMHIKDFLKQAKDKTEPQRETIPGGEILIPNLTRFSVNCGSH